MGDPISQQIMEAVDTALKTIWRTNGYNTDLGDKVYEWRAFPLNFEDAEGVIYKDAFYTMTRAIGEDVHELTVDFILICQSSTPAETTRNMIADLIKCVAANKTWGGLAEDTDIGTAEDVEYAQNERTYAGVRFRGVIQFRTEPGDPYTQA